MTHELIEAALLPCPWCGAPAKLWNNSSLDFEVYCKNACGQSVGCGYTTPKQAITGWNTRAALPPDPAVEKLAGWLRRCLEVFEGANGVVITSISVEDVEKAWKDLEEWENRHDR